MLCFRYVHNVLGAQFIPIILVSYYMYMCHVDCCRCGQLWVILQVYGASAFDNSSYLLQL